MPRIPGRPERIRSGGPTMMTPLWRVQVLRDGEELCSGTVRPGEERVLGRDPGADLVVMDRSVSRRHCLLRGTGEGIEVGDLGSVNGVWMDGRRLERVLLGSGDEARLGLLRLLVMEMPAQTGMIPVEGLSEDRSPPTRTTGTAPPEAGRAGSQRSVLESDRKVYHGIEKERLALLLETGKSLASTVQVDELLERIVDHLFQIFPVRRAVVALLDEDGNLVPRHVRPETEERELSSACSRSIVQQVIESGRPRIIEDASADQDLNTACSILISDIKAAICAPLVSHTRTVGALYADYPGRARLYSAGDLDFFMAFASFAAVALENARMQQELRDQERLQRDLEIAAEIQQGLLPNVAYEFEGLEMDWAYWPSAHVGGDFYDCLPLDDGRVALILGDVSGKSVGSALFMARLMSCLRAVAPDDPGPGAVLTRTNRQLGIRLDRVFFATACYILLEPGWRRFTYASAGHNPALILDPGGDTFRELPPTGIPMGIESGYEYTRGRGTLERGSLVVMYTDGIVEARNAAGEFFGLDAVKDIVLESREAGPKEILRTLITRVQEFLRGSRHVRDDIALMVLRVTS